MESNIPKKRRRKDEAIAEYRILTRAAKNVARNEDPKVALELIARDMKRSKELYPLVSKKLDGTSADARHAKELTNLGKDTANKINVSQRHIDLKQQLIWLKRDIEVETGSLPDKKQFFDYCISNFVSECQYRVPVFEHFYGIINEDDLQVKERKVREPRERDVATQATTAKERDIEVDVEQDQTPKEVEEIFTRIRRLSVSSNRRESVPFFSIVVDRDSFVKTVENIFHTSFLVKEGKIGIKLEQEIPVVSVEDKRGTQEAGDEEASLLNGNQSILSFSYADYRRWVEQSF